jgi:hypothetical protein
MYTLLPISKLFEVKIVVLSLIFGLKKAHVRKHFSRPIITNMAKIGTDFYFVVRKIAFPRPPFSKTEWLQSYP